MNPNLKINILSDPFPHIMIEDLFTGGELKAIWEEVNFLRHCNSDLSGFTSSKRIDTETGKSIDKSKYQIVWFSEIYKRPEISTFSTHLKNLHSQGLFYLFSQVHPNAKRFACSNNLNLNTITKLNVYCSGDKYESHFDYSEFTSLFYLQSKKINFSGGELKFVEYGYSFPCNNNSFILFPGAIDHEVTEISAPKNVNSSEPLRVALNTFYNFTPHL